MPEWVGGSALGEAWRRWRASARARPAGSWWRFAAWAGGGFVVVFGLSVAAAVAGRAAGPAWLDAWDRRWMHAFIEHAPISFLTGVLFESGGNVFVLAPLTAFVALVAAWRRRPVDAVAILAAYWLARPILYVGWWIWARSRPQFVAGGVASPGVHSFPSGHALLAAAVYTFLASLWIRASRSRGERVFAAVAFAVLALIVSLSRLRLGAHWPSDVIVGLLLGTLWGLAVAIAAASGPELPDGDGER